MYGYSVQGLVAKVKDTVVNGYFGQCVGNPCMCVCFSVEYRHWLAVCAKCCCKQRNSNGVVSLTCMRVCVCVCVHGLASWV